MKFNGADIKRVYFIGIGGIGMSALARYFHEHGVKVSGYDRTPSALCRELEQEGISIHYDENLEPSIIRPIWLCTRLLFRPITANYSIIGIRVIGCSNAAKYWA